MNLNETEKDLLAVILSQEYVDADSREVKDILLDIMQKTGCV